jgi:hypothetical protein
VQRVTCGCRNADAGRGDRGVAGRGLHRRRRGGRLRPGADRTGKIKKNGERITLELARTPDILAKSPRTHNAPRLVVGFAAETDNVEAYARGKLEKKKLDLIAANRVGIAGSGFESDDNALTIYGPAGRTRVRPGNKNRARRPAARPHRGAPQQCTTSSN